MADMFLTKDELMTLTARKSKRHQIEQLRSMGIPFFINAVNGPVVTRSAVEGRPIEAPALKRKWRSNALNK